MHTHTTAQEDIVKTDRERKAIIEFRSEIQKREKENMRVHIE
jgi:hypothetical protein